jgi:hypothetical protein
MASSVRTIVSEAGGDFLVCDLVPSKDFINCDTHAFSLVFDARKSVKDSSHPATLTLTYCDRSKTSSGIVFQVLVDDKFIKQHFESDVGLESTIHAYSGHFGRSLARPIQLDDSFSASLTSGDAAIVGCAYFVGSSALADAGTKLIGKISLPVVQRELDVRVCRQIHSLAEQCMGQQKVSVGPGAGSSSLVGEMSPSPVRSSGALGAGLAATNSPGIRFELLEEDTSNSYPTTASADASAHVSRQAGLTKPGAKRRRLGGVNLIATKR